MYIHKFAFHTFNCLSYSFLIDKRWLLKQLPYETYCGLSASK